MEKATPIAGDATNVARLVETFGQIMSEQSGSFAELEQAAMAVANTLVRTWIESELGRMARRYDDEIFVDGQRHRRHASGKRRYHTLCGSVEVTRETYRLVGVHNGSTVVPLELEAGIVENATPALAASALQAFASMPLRHYEDEMRAAHRVVPSRSTLERITKRIGDDLHSQLPLIEPVLRASEAVPAEAASISVGIDRTTIPMAEQLTPIPGDLVRRRARRPPPPIVVAYRMAYVATVAINDEDGDTLVSKRIAATADEGPVEMMERLGAELQHLLEQRPKLPVVVVQDGAPELWNLVEEWFENFGVPIEMKLLDRYHLDERLAQVAEILERDDRDRRRLLETWRASLDRGDGAIRRICQQIEDRCFPPAAPADDHPGFAWAPERRMPRFTRHSINELEGHLGYCENNKERMRYATARKRGFPVGSGVTEGACKSVIACRLKRSGQRWFESGASACLQLRTLHLNGRLRGGFGIYVELRKGSLVAA